MKKTTIDYKSFRDMDIFLSHSNKPFGRIIRIAETMKFAPKDDTTPTHGGFITENYGQFFATEMGLHLQENSLEKYAGTREQIVQVWRCVGFDDGYIRMGARQRLSYLRREQKNYDLQGAILSSPLGRKLFGKMPWFKNNAKGDFCTENVADILRTFVDSDCPVAPNPLELSNYFKSKSKLYVLVSPNVNSDMEL
jgi:hypothetical protein